MINFQNGHRKQTANGLKLFAHAQVVSDSVSQPAKVIGCFGVKEHTCDQLLFESKIKCLNLPLFWPFWP